MKPIVLIEKNGKVILSKEDLQNIIEDVYEEGKKDGRNCNSYYCNWYFCPYRDRNTWDWTKVTCKTTTDAKVTCKTTTDPTSVPIMTTDSINTDSYPKNTHAHITATLSNDDHTTTWIWDPRTITFKAKIDEEDKNE